MYAASIVNAHIDCGLTLRQKDKEDLEEVANELELADDEDLIPLVLLSTSSLGMLTDRLLRYMIGDSFVSLPASEVQTRLSSSVEKADDEVRKLEERMSDIRCFVSSVVLLLSSQARNPNLCPRRHSDMSPIVLGSMSLYSCSDLYLTLRYQG